MPICSYQCISCSKIWDELRRRDEMDDPAECTTCEAPAHRRVTAMGGYQGNTGGASTKPRGAGAQRNGEPLNFKKDDKVS